MKLGHLRLGQLMLDQLKLGQLMLGMLMFGRLKLGKPIFGRLMLGKGMLGELKEYGGRWRSGAQPRITEKTKIARKILIELLEQDYFDETFRNCILPTEEVARMLWRLSSQRTGMYWKVEFKLLVSAYIDNKVSKLTRTLWWWWCKCWILPPPDRIGTDKFCRAIHSWEGHPRGRFRQLSVSLMFWIIVVGWRKSLLQEISKFCWERISEKLSKGRRW